MKKVEFQYKAFIQNTKDIREWLVKHLNVNIKDVDPKHRLLLFKQGYCSSSHIQTNYDLLVMGNYIDCRSNPQLFKAISAIKKNSDEGQWFTDDKEWVMSDIHDLLSIPEYLKEKGFNVSKTHKATLEELQEYFKK